MIPLSGIFGLMAASVGLDELSVAGWPHHRAIVDLAKGVGDTSPLRRTLARISMTPSANVGIKAAGVDEALTSLVAASLLTPMEVPARRLRIHEGWLHQHSILLRSLPGEDRRLLRQAGTRWAASCMLASKQDVSASLTPSG